MTLLPISTDTRRSLVADEHGQDLVEYALLFSLIALAAVAAVRSAALGVLQVFSAVGSTLTSST